MRRTQIMRLRVIRGQTERAEGRHLVAVVVGECGHGFSRAADLRAQSSVHLRQRTAHPVAAADAAPGAPGTA